MGVEVITNSQRKGSSYFNNTISRLGEEEKCS